MSDKKDPKKDMVRKKRLGGVVVSDKMDKTITVSVSTLKEHKKYKKRFRFSKKYKAHDPFNHFKEGDSVEIIECRPISRDKTWRVIYNAKDKKDIENKKDSKIEENK